MRELVRWLWRASVGPASLGARRRAIYCVAARASASGRELRRDNDILATAREQKASSGHHRELE
jgi:glucose dehydrogenase